MIYTLTLGYTNGNHMHAALWLQQYTQPHVSTQKHAQGIVRTVVTTTRATASMLSSSCVSITCPLYTLGPRATGRQSEGWRLARFETIIYVWRYSAFRGCLGRLGARAPGRQSEGWRLARFDIFVCPAVCQDTMIRHDALLSDAVTVMVPGSDPRHLHNAPLERTARPFLL